MDALSPPPVPPAAAGPAPARTHFVSPYAAPSGECRDWAGRRYVVGPSARVLAGRDRSRQLAGAASALAAVGILQFGYGAAVPGLAALHDWSPAAALLPLALWAVVQAGTAAPLALLRERGRARPAAAVPLGAALAAAGLLALGHSPTLTGAVLGYGLLGGAGAGIVYHSCVRLAAAWFPERTALHTAFTGGAFALGTVPLLAAAGGPVGPGALPGVTAVLAAAVAVVGACAGARLSEPPGDWWPPDSDPRRWALTQRRPRAGRDLSPAQARRSGALGRLHLVVAASGAAALFDLAVLPLLLGSAGFAPAAIAAAAACLVAGSGLGRAAAARFAEAGDARTVLAAACAVAAAAHAGLAAAVAAGSPWAAALCALLAGAGAGPCYPLTRELAADFFGRRDAARIQGLVYSAKGVGGAVGIGGGALLIAAAPAALPVAGPAAAGAAAALAAVAAVRLRRPLPVAVLPRPAPQ